MLLPLTQNQAFCNAKIKKYPNGDCYYSVFSKSVYNPLNCEEVGKDEKEKISKKKSKDNDVRQDNLKRAKEKVFDIALCNDWNYFITLTLDPQKVDRYDTENINKVVKKWLDNSVQRKNLRYLMLPELHKDGAVHFHGLVNSSLKMTDSQTFIVPGKKKPVKKLTLDKLGFSAEDEAVRRVFNIDDWKLGFSSAINLDDNCEAVAKYITKYITKDCQKIMGKFYYAGGKGLVRECPTEYLDIDYNSFVGAEYKIPAGFMSVKYYIYRKGAKGNE